MVFNIHQIQHLSTAQGSIRTPDAQLQHLPLSAAVREQVTLLQGRVIYGAPPTRLTEGVKGWGVEGLLYREGVKGRVTVQGRGERKGYCTGKG